jgi:hypothetical protein
VLQKGGCLFVLATSEILHRRPRKVPLPPRRPTQNHTTSTLHTNMSDQQQHQTTGAGPETKSTTDYTYKPYDKNSKDSSSQKSTSTCDFCDKEGNEQYSCRAGHTYVVCDDCSKSSQKTFKKIFKTGTTPLFFPIFFLLLLPRTSRLALFGCQLVSHGLYGSLTPPTLLCCALSFDPPFPISPSPPTSQATRKH